MSRARIAGYSILLAALIVVCALAGWAFFYEPSRLETVHYDVPLAGLWRDGQNRGGSALPLTIALLSDVHAGSPHFGLAMIQRVVDSVNRARPDLVLLAGDYVVSGMPGARFVPPEEIAEVLSGLEAPLGVFAVLGNHDVWFGAKKVERAFEGVGIPVLTDEAIRLALPGVRATAADTDGHFWLVGVNDFLTSRPDVAKALEGVNDDAPLIAFTHNPDVFPTLPERVGLTLAGHTHGGQVRLPFVGTPVVPSRYGSRYARGLVVEGEKTLFVTSGLGTSILPVRFGVTPEVALLHVYDPLPIATPGLGVASGAH